MYITPPICLGYSSQLVHSFTLVQDNDKCLNIPLLVRYINKHHIAVVWTMHDCRAFTGQCSYFDEVNCSHWKNGCGNCPQCETWIDNTHRQWQLRQQWHTAFENLTIVTPSQWLASFVKESIFKKNQVEVIYNGVDTNKFIQKPNCNIYSKYHIDKKKKIVLGCSIHWESRKGITYFEQKIFNTKKYNLYRTHFYFR